MIFWNQKEILFKEISRVIKKYNIKSILDVGAGDGVLAIKIADTVSTYTAIEKNTKNIKKLEDMGLKVLRGDFPLVQTQKKFDMVVSSHSIPENLKSVDAFVKHAWNLVRPGGLLFLATFKGSRGDRFKLTKMLGENPEVLDKKIYKKTLEILRELGQPRVYGKQSKIETDNLSEMLQVVLFTICKNNKTKKELIKKILKKKILGKKRKKIYISF